MTVTQEILQVLNISPETLTEETQFQLKSKLENFGLEVLEIAKKAVSAADLNYIETALDAKLILEDVIEMIVLPQV